MTFPPLENFYHVAVSASIDFPINLKENALFHCVAYDYSCADWGGLCDHLRDVPWEDICNCLSQWDYAGRICLIILHF